ncbi:PDZ domain-containing protein [Nocardioides sp. cx-169]|uniref:YlbL family protein n=1 Tax=Nocardioides sp. cx-169 TaxID=2899080 RepID=UPI001E2EDB36|nr:PDZ domain-containing protein [Nocardioides sp. cx-169]MCD4534243.1 PDZ domain-containing protein [Nocardioides sp. cx-169]
MSQRLMAALIAGPLVLVLLVLAAFLPLDYVTYRPGQTVDVLAETDGSEIIQVDGHEAYRDDGELRMTTVLVSLPKDDAGDCGSGCRKNLFDLMAAWISPDDAVYPYDAVYDDDETQESNDREGAVSMVTSQDAAIAAALRELGVKFTSAVEVSFVEEGMPAEGKLLVGDVLLEVNGEKVTSAQQIQDAVKATKPGESVDLRIRRDRTELDVKIVPRMVKGQKMIGITPGNGFVFPFDVKVNIDPNIGGPSAGLMFALSIYDTLTPGSLTGGHVVAGSGEIDPAGKVGPIGGIQQKIAGARDDGAELFLVPADNCDEALGADPGDMRLVRATTMHEAREAIEDWVADPGADLPSCEDAA